MWHAKEADLEDIGLVQKGDIVTLKAFCLIRDETGDKRKLATFIKGTSLERLPGESKSKKKKRLSSKNVGLGWMNFDPKKKKYIPIRASKGGGIRFETFLNTAGKEIILMKMMDLFFPNGKSFAGKNSCFDFQLGNFRGEPINNEEENRFCLSDYIKKHKLSKTRLYLMSKEKSKLEKLMESLKGSCDSWSDDDDFMISKDMHSSERVLF